MPGQAPSFPCSPDPGAICKIGIGLLQGPIKITECLINSEENKKKKKKMMSSPLIKAMIYSLIFLLVCGHLSHTDS